LLQALLFITEKNGFTDQPTQIKPPHNTTPTPDHILSELGCQMLYYTVDQDLPKLLQHAEGILLQVSNERLNQWVAKLRGLRDLPLIWWNEEKHFPLPRCEIKEKLDGVMFPSMNSTQLHWCLFLSARSYQERMSWNQEKSQLLGRLEERKWIDQAKAILCEIKQINEEEAYRFLRKQAMNERKRMSDVAASIVKVYKLIRD
jgi:response regulator NasT